MASRVVVFVHGLFMTPLIWERWLPRFSERGYACVVPAWPGFDRSAAALRADRPDPKIAALTFDGVVAHIAEAIDALGEWSIVVGHGVGGLVAQIMVNRGAVAAGIAIHSAAPRLAFPAGRRAERLASSLFGRGDDPSQPKALGFEEFRSVFGNALPPESQQAVFDRHIAPGSPRVADDLRGNVARIDFARAHPPLLMTAGVLDRAVPARRVFNNFSRYRQRGAITDFHAFDGRGHMVLVEPDWKEVADYVADWISRLKV